MEVEERKDGPDARESFRMYDDGQFKQRTLQSRHPNILKCVIAGKKSWGLWLDQWTDGVVDWTFTQEEILQTFKEKGIKVPESFLKDFENTVERKKKKRNQKYLEEILQKDNEGYISK